MNMISLTSQTFREVLEQHELVVLDFWAKWCEPCKAFAKVVEHLSNKYPDVIFATVDIDQEKELAQDFEIRSVPSIMILKNQVAVYADSGALSESVLIELIEKAKLLDV